MLGVRTRGILGLGLGVCRARTRGMLGLGLGVC